MRLANYYITSGFSVGVGVVVEATTTIGALVVLNLFTVNTGGLNETEGGARVNLAEKR